MKIRHLLPIPCLALAMLLSALPTATITAGPTNALSGAELCPKSSSGVLNAEETFWDVFQHQDYRRAEEGLVQMKAALASAEKVNDECGMFLMNARIAFTNTWLVTEYSFYKKEVPDGKLSPRKLVPSATKHFGVAVGISKSIKGKQDGWGSQLLPAVVQGFNAGFVSAKNQKDHG